MVPLPRAYQFTPSVHLHLTAAVTFMCARSVLSEPQGSYGASLSQGLGDTVSVQMKDQLGSYYFFFPLPGFLHLDDKY